MTRAKVKITPLGRRIQSSDRQRSSGGLNRKGCKDHGSWDRDADNCAPSLDLNVIEEIANGVEKMILSWSHLDEGEQMHKASALEDEKLTPEKDSLSMIWNLPEANKLWMAKKQSESGIEGNGEIGLNDEKLSQSVPQGSSNDHGGEHCGVTAQTVMAPQTSDLLCNGDKSAEEMEELQIALLECATEYEIKVCCRYSSFISSYD